MNTTREPIILSSYNFSEWEQEEIDTLPKRQRKAFHCVIRKGIPLNKRMRRLWHEVQMFANASEMSNWLAEHDGWGME